MLPQQPRNFCNPALYASVYLSRAGDVVLYMCVDHEDVARLQIRFWVQARSTHVATTQTQRCYNKQAAVEHHPIIFMQYAQLGA
jgi:hypothetical protein